MQGVVLREIGIGLGLGVVAASMWKGYTTEQSATIANYYKYYESQQKKKAKTAHDDDE